jgi:phosphoglycerate dehydrogenase-like enzyme
MRVIYHDAIKAPPEAEKQLNVEYLPLDQLLAEADFLSVHVPLLPETRHLLSAAQFEKMKRTAYIINTSRGPVIDEAALVEALSAGRLRGAALDVFEREPLPADHALFALPNVLLSPHCADHVAGWRESSVALFLDNLERFRRGEPVRNLVDKRRGY